MRSSHTRAHSRYIVIAGVALLPGYVCPVCVCWCALSHRHTLSLFPLSLLLLQVGEYERWQRLDQQISDRVQRHHATSQVARHNLDDVASGGWRLLSQAEAVRFLFVPFCGRLAVS